MALSRVGYKRQQGGHEAQVQRSSWQVEQVDGDDEGREETKMYSRT